MEHGFGQPFVGEVFEQGVYKCQRRIGRYHAAPGKGRLKAADQRRRIGDRLRLAIGAFKIERGQEWRLGRWHTWHTQGRRVQAVGDAPVAQYGQHFPSVGRAWYTV